MSLAIVQWTNILLIHDAIRLTWTVRLVVVFWIRESRARNFESGMIETFIAAPFP